MGIWTPNFWKKKSLAAYKKKLIKFLIEAKMFFFSKRTLAVHNLVHTGASKIAFLHFFFSDTNFKEEEYQHVGFCWLYRHFTVLLSSGLYGNFRIWRNQWLVYPKFSTWSRRTLVHESYPLLSQPISSLYIVNKFSNYCHYTQKQLANVVFDWR